MLLWYRFPVSEFALSLSLQINEEKSPWRRVYCFSNTRRQSQSKKAALEHRENPGMGWCFQCVTILSHSCGKYVLISYFALKGITALFKAEKPILFFYIPGTSKAVCLMSSATITNSSSFKTCDIYSEQAANSELCCRRQFKPALFVVFLDTDEKKMIPFGHFQVFCGGKIE